MYLSYIGYFLVPASGPNIHCNLARPGACPIESLGLYHFTDDLPGTWLAEPLRRWMFEVELTKKDCFPSGHVAVAIVCWILARRIHRPLGFVFGVLAAGVILSTVYLRYHYVVDVIAGALLAAFALTGWLRLHDRLAADVRSGRESHCDVNTAANVFPPYWTSEISGMGFALSNVRKPSPACSRSQGIPVSTKRSPTTTIGACSRLRFSCASLKSSLKSSP